jgi:hypothetical protein
MRSIVVSIDISCSFHASSEAVKLASGWQEEAAFILDGVDYDA